MIRYYFDVHVPRSVAEQLRRRGIEILTAQEDGSATLPDDALLERATSLVRIMVTSDIRFRALAEHWQQENHAFAGLVFAHPLLVTIGKMVLDLELLAKAASQEEMTNEVLHLPL